MISSDRSAAEVPHVRRYPTLATSGVSSLAEVAEVTSPGVV